MLASNRSHRRSNPSSPVRGWWCALVLCGMLSSALPVSATMIDAEELVPGVAAAGVVLDDQALRDEVMRTVDRKLRELREQLSSEIDAIVKQRTAALLEENARLRRGLQELRASQNPPARAPEAPTETQANNEAPFFGVSFQVASADLARRAGSESDRCLEVVHVLEGSPAAALGMQPGDLITAIDGQSASHEQFLSAIDGKRPGDSVQVVFLQTRSEPFQRVEGQTRLAARGRFADAIARLAQTPPAPRAPSIPAPSAPPPVAPPGSGPVSLGMTVELTEQNELVAVEVSPGSNAAVAGLEVGDRLLALDGKHVDDFDKVRAVLSSWRPGQQVVIRYARGARTHEATLHVAGPGGAPSLVKSSLGQGPASGAVTLGILAEPDDAGRPRVTEVTPGSNAAELGLRSGDVIVAVDGERLGDIDTLKAALARWKAGTQVTVIYRRERQTFSGTIELAAVGGKPRLVELREVEARRGAGAAAGPGRTGDAPARGGRRLGMLGVALAEHDQGIAVTTVAEGSTARAMGLQVGDVIQEVQGRAVRNRADLRGALETLSAGDEVTVIVLRDGARKTFTGTLRARPPQAPQAEAGPATTPAVPVDPAPARRPQAGAPAAGKPPVSLGILALEARGGVVIEELLPDSAAGTAGLLPGDRFTTINGRPIDSYSALRAALSDRRPGDRLLVRVRRGSDDRRFEVELGAQPAAIQPGAVRPGPVQPGATQPAAQPRSEQPVARATVQPERPFAGFELEEFVGRAEVSVLTVEPGTPAERAGLRGGDRVVRIDGKSVSTLGDVRQWMATARPGQEAAIEILRDGRPVTLELVLGGR